MRIFKYIAITMMALIVIFFSLGLFISNISYTNTVTINASPEKTFESFCDTSLMKLWMPGFVAFEKISGSNRESGSKWKLVLEQEGERYDIMETMTVFKPARQYSFLLENAVLRNEVDVYFKEKNGHTEISSENKVRGNNVMWRSIFVLMKSGFYDQGQLMFNNLKKVIESDQNIK